MISESNASLDSIKMKSNICGLHMTILNDPIELVESFRDTINSTRDLYMASISMQMND
jgi:hypothetical protein